MASLKIVPYAYVPTKPRSGNKDQLSSVDKHPGAYRVTQQSMVDVLPEKVLQSSIAGLGDAPRAGAKSRHESVRLAAPDASTKGGIQDTAFPSSEVLPSDPPAAAPSDEAGSSQAGFMASGTVDADDSSSDLHSIFGDINSFFEEQGVNSVIESKESHVTYQHTDASVCQTERIAPEDGFGKSNTLPSESQLAKTQSNRDQRRDDAEPVDNSSSEGGSSDESDEDSVFDRCSERSKLGSRNSCLDSSAFINDIDKTTTNATTRYDTHHLLPITDLIERNSDDASIEPSCTSPVIAKRQRTVSSRSTFSYGKYPKSDLDESDHDVRPKRPRSSSPVGTTLNKYKKRPRRFPSVILEDELDKTPINSAAREPVSTPTTNSSASESALSMEPQLVAQVIDADKQWDVRKIIGKEYVDGVLHYWVAWCETLEPVHSLCHAKELVDEFEARLQAQRDAKNGGGRSGMKRSGRAAGVRDSQQQKRPRGRPRKEN